MKIYEDKLRVQRNKKDDLRPANAEDEESEELDLQPVTAENESDTKKKNSPTDQTKKPEKEAPALSELDKAMGELSDIVQVIKEDGQRQRASLEAPTPEKSEAPNPENKEKAAATPTKTAAATPEKTSAPTTSSATPEDPTTAMQLFAKNLGTEYGVELGTIQGEGEKTSEEIQTTYDTLMQTQNQPAPAVSMQPEMSREQAAQYYPNNFANGYLIGFNRGYAEGMAIQRIKAQQAKEAAQAALKERAAYQEGYAAALNDTTSPSPESKAETQKLEQKYLAPVDAKRQAQSQNGVEAAPISEAENQDYQAFTMGYNNGYAAGLSQVQAAKKAKFEAEKEMPAHKAGEAFGQAVAAGEADAKDYDNEAARSGNEPLFLRGYNVAYAQKLHKEKMEKAALSNPKMVAENPETKPFFEQGASDASSGKKAISEALELAKIMVGLEERPDESKEEFMKRVKRAQGAYNMGYNQGYGEKLKAQQNNKPIKYKQGLAIGRIIGTIAAQPTENQENILQNVEIFLNDKAGDINVKGANTLDKLKNYLSSLKAFIPETNKKDIEKDEAAMGKQADFDKGYNQAYNKAYNVAYAKQLAKSQSRSRAKSASGAQQVNDEVQAIIAAYEGIGDVDMVERLYKQYYGIQENTYKDIYNSITSPFDAEAKQDEQFASIPTAADLSQKQLEASKSALQKIKDSYNKEIATLQTRKKAATQDNNIGLIDRIDFTFMAIEEEIKTLHFAAEQGYAQANTKAQDDGYSFVQGFDSKIKNPTELPKPVAPNEAEIKKGIKAAEKFGTALRINAKLAKDGYKPAKELKMPPVVVSSAYKQGHSEASQKWRIVKLIGAGIPIPVRLRDGEMYKAYNTEAETTLPITEAELKSLSPTDQAPNSTPEGLKPEEKPQALTRATYGAEGARFVIPEKADDAKFLAENTGPITTTDIEFFQAELAAGYFEKVLELKKAREANIKGPVQLEFEAAQSKFAHATKENIRAASEPYFAALQKYIAEILASKPNLEPHKNTALAGIELAQKELSKSLNDKELEALRAALNKATSPILSPADDEVTLMKSKTLKTRLRDLQKLYKEVYSGTTEYGAAKSCIEAAAADFKSGYETAREAALKDQTQTDENDENNFANYLEDYAEEIGYANGFVQKIAQLGLDDNNTPKALNIIQKFVLETQANIPSDTAKHIVELKNYAVIEDVEILPTEDSQLYLTKAGDKVQKIYKNAHTSFTIIGQADALAAYNLSTDDFSFVSGTRYRNENSNEIRPLGPLGTLADKYFKKIIELAQNLSVSNTLKAPLNQSFTAINKHKNPAELLDDDKSILLEFKKTLFGDNAIVFEEIFNKKWTLRPESEAVHKSTDQLFQINFAPKSEAIVDASKFLFKVGNESKTPKGNDKITLISDKNQQVTICGSGINMYQGNDPTALFAPRVIIPSLQKQLLAKDPKNPAKTVRVDADFVTTHLLIGEGAIRLDRESLKNTFTQLRNNLISALNTKEEADYNRSDTPRIAPDNSK